jgi:hypothetical protein
MVDPSSPEDPLFFLHHANVDRIWSIWQDVHGQSSLEEDQFFVPVHYEGRLLDQPMPYSNGRWDFRIDGSSTPTPRQVLSNSGSIIQVRYVQDNIIPGYTPNRRWFGSASSEINGCRRRPGSAAATATTTGGTTTRPQTQQQPTTSSTFFFNRVPSQGRSWPTSSRGPPGRERNLRPAQVLFSEKDDGNEMDHLVDDGTIGNRMEGGDRIVVGGIQRDGTSAIGTGIEEGGGGGNDDSKAGHYLRNKRGKRRQGRLFHPYDGEHSTNLATTGSTTTSSSSTTGSTTSLCDEYSHVFHDESDRYRWIQLCNDNHQMTLLEDGTGEDEDGLLALLVKNITTTMAMEECSQFDNPRSATDDWISMMHMENQRVTFECFHIPDVFVEIES